MSARLSFPSVLSLCICISKSVLFFRCPQNSLNGFFSQIIDLFVPQRMTDILCLFHVFFPYMPCHHFHMILTFRTFLQIRAGRAVFSAAFVFLIPITVCCPIFQNVVFGYTGALRFFRNYPFFSSNYFISMIKYWYQTKAVNENG